MRLSRGALAGGLAAVVIILAGCRAAGPRNATVLYTPAALSVESAGPESFYEALSPSAAERAELALIPAGVLKLNRLEEVVQVSRGWEYKAVLSKQTDVSGSPYRVLLFGADWSSKGRLTTPSASGGWHQDGAWVGWSAEEPVLAVFLRLIQARKPETWGRCNVLVSRPPRWQLEMIGDVDEVEELDGMWAGGRILLIYREKHRAEWPRTLGNTVQIIDSESRANRIVYPEEQQARLSHALPSPDGSRLAFTRVPVGVHRNGLGLMDLQTGRCRLLTYEDEQAYYHRPLRWESPDVLVFARLGVGAEHYEPYRIRLAPAAAP